MKDYIVHEGKVVEVKITSISGRRMCYKYEGSFYQNVNSDLRCNKHGKSFNTGEYYNWKDTK